MIFLFIIASILQLLYYWSVFSRLAWYTSPNFEESTNTIVPISVSIIICAKNEADNLQQYLPCIVEQVYPNFEVIVVNDGSTDNTSLILANFQQQYKQLKVIHITPSLRQITGKKQALAQGILAAKHDYLLLTDADCMPTSNQWLQQMAQQFSTEITVVLGYAPYLPANSFLNKCVQFETTLTAIQYLSYALLGYPYMGVGRNLAYKKSLFFESKGFQSHQQVLSGDDDLFINQVAHNKNTSINLNSKAFCYSKAASSWQEWYQQKQRHLSTGKHYQLGHQLMLGLFSLSHFLFYGMLIVGLIQQTYLIVLVFIYLLRLVSQLWLFKRILTHFRLKSLWYWIPLLDFLYCFYYLVFTPSLLLNKKIKWKYKVP